MIKKLFTIFASIVLFAWCYPPSVVSAHLLGQPPFFKVNNKYAPFYNVQSTSLESFALPQDAGPEYYLVNTPIAFELDVSQLPVPPDIVKKTTFAWDFGDNHTGTGLKNAHTYSKIGSYVLTITASYTDNGQTVPPQLLETIMLQVLPNMSYKLPIAHILVNGQEVLDPTKNAIHFDPGMQVAFDGSTSTAPSSKIVEYFWDAGDGTTANTKSFTHTYSKMYQLVYPVLRIKDANGFIIDTYTQLDNAPGHGLQPKKVKTNAQTQKKSGEHAWIFIGVILIAVVIVVSIAAMIMRKKTLSGRK